jgi:hypothetical protein
MMIFCAEKHRKSMGILICLRLLFAPPGTPENKPTVQRLALWYRQRLAGR